MKIFGDIDKKNIRDKKRLLTKRSGKNVHDVTKMESFSRIFSLTKKAITNDGINEMLKKIDLFGDDLKNAVKRDGITVNVMDFGETKEF